MTMLLAQYHLSDTDAIDVLSFSTFTKIRMIIIANANASEVTYSLYFDKGEGLYSSENVLFNEIALDGDSSDVLEFDAGTFEENNANYKIGCSCNTSDALTISIFGDKQ